MDTYLHECNLRVCILGEAPVFINSSRTKHSVGDLQECLVGDKVSPYLPKDRKPLLNEVCYFSEAATEETADTIS